MSLVVWGSSPLALFSGVIAIGRSVAVVKLAGCFARLQDGVMTTSSSCRFRKYGIDHASTATLSPNPVVATRGDAGPSAATSTATLCANVSHDAVHFHAAADTVSRATDAPNSDAVGIRRRYFLRIVERGPSAVVRWTPAPVPRLLIATGGALLLGQIRRLLLEHLRVLSRHPRSSLRRHSQ